MSRSVLIVDKDAARRGALAAACSAKGADVKEAEDPFSAMAAFGQRSFDVLCAHAGPRHLSLRGLFQLAKRKRDDTTIWVLVEAEDRTAVELSFATEASVLDLALGAEPLAAAIVDGVAPEAPPPAQPNDEDLHVDFDDLPITAPPSLDDQFDGDFTTPAPAGAWDASSGGENDDVDTSLLSTSGEGGALPTGAETLIDAFAREVSGRLVIGDGQRAWGLYLYGGEPAWVDPPGGDREIFERLVGRRLLEVDAEPSAVPEGALMSSLIESGALSADAAGAFMRQLLFDASLEIAGLDSCTADVEDAPHFLSTPPPFRVNPFGVVLESRRRRQRPDELILLARELSDATVVARRGLDKIYGKVAPFLRGIDVRTLLAEGSTVRHFREAAGVDDILATQLVLALEAVGLLRIERVALSA